MSNDKNIPNPYGRKGGIEHQAKVKEVATDIKERGFLAVFEKFLRLFNGKGKFMDVVAIEEENNQIVEIHQVGKQNQDGRPVKRERDTIEEVTQNYGIKPMFHSYNKKD
ncbi:MAG TPA: hypothetical protein PK079_11610 [Leptospiraceae bacterium]|nr:hypothetical protein [Leptospiraceae bacterium]HMW05372.1 hypothetical protein [Leptospiraceae bacterium]HMY31567.1 hypothetical protein [Leptospiraceae bacterium]HMZ64474.1 hypothetical protein [Leptospiraceae bacterium]HNA10429.1 hypothetical protein [Leptospiraceae bacterium]